MKIVNIKNHFNRQNVLYILFAIFITCLIISNCVSAKLFELPFSLFGEPVMVPVAIIVYPITFIVTDVIGEKYGYKESKQAIWLGFISQILASIIIVITQVIPATDPTMQDHYIALLGQNRVFMLASLAAYLVSQLTDRLIFHKMRNYFISKNNKKMKWLYSAVSTVVGQIIDSVIYITIAFGLGFGMLWTNPIPLLNMVIGQAIFKIVVSLLSIPLFYLLTMERRKNEQH